MKSRWIFLSPHLDDAALSCGGLIHDLARAGSQVEIWTICAGDPPAGPLPPFAQMLEERWQTGPASMHARRAEDQAACALLGAHAVHFDLPDCIYRRLPDGSPLVNSEDDLWQPLPESEKALAAQLAGQIAARLPGRCQLTAPLTLGDHIDHRLVHAAALQLPRALHLYADFPYAVRPGVDRRRYIQSGWRRETYPVSSTGFHAWQAAIACYGSQISSLWRDLDEMRSSLREYFNKGGGRSLWRKPE